jgi:hypothetical protein
MSYLVLVSDVNATSFHKMRTRGSFDMETAAPLEAVESAMDFLPLAKQYALTNPHSNLIIECHGKDNVVIGNVKPKHSKAAKARGEWIIRSATWGDDY